METIKVYVDNRKDGVVIGRKVVEAELVENRSTSVIVRLPDGNVIKRKKSRDIVVEEK